MNQKGVATIIPVIIILAALFGIGAAVFFYGRGNYYEPNPTSTLIYSVTPAPIIKSSPTPSPTSAPSGIYSYTELKYLLIQRFNPIFFCDPDYYPVGRGDEQQLAIEKFPSIQQNSEEFQAIMNHLGFSGVLNFSDAQKLQIYRQHKKLNALSLIPGMEPGASGAYSFNLRSGNEIKGSGLAIDGIITAAGLIIISKSETTFLTCPICLARDTRISTPSGEIPVQDLQIGMKVWTSDSAGIKRQAEILQVSKTPAPPNHQMVHLVLSDGRELFVSPGHPTADGRIIGNLIPGDTLNGAKVFSTELVQYNQEFTYDILPAQPGPSGNIGTYWANGILIGSTLKITKVFR